MSRFSFLTSKIVVAVIALCSIQQAAFGAPSAEETIVVGTSPTYPPLESRNPQTDELVGLDIDLVKAIGQHLHIKIQWKELSYPEIPSALVTKRVDFVASGVTDIGERRKSMDFVDYFSTGTQLFTLSEQSKDFPNAAAVCGKSVAVNRNGIFLIRMQEFSQRECVAKGRAAVLFSLTDKTSDARLQLIEGRAVAAAQGTDAIRYLNEDLASSDKGRYALIGTPIAVDHAGFAFAKSNPGLRDRVAGALQAMMKDGTYQKIFEKWHLEYAEMVAPNINNAR